MPHRFRTTLAFPLPPLGDDERLRTHVHLLQFTLCDGRSGDLVCGVGQCPALPKSRRYCTYRHGPAGWSWAPGDPFSEAFPPELDFMGCNLSILEGRNLTRRLFTIRHEMEHERQRWCNVREDLRSTFDLMHLEFEANSAAWRAVCRMRPSLDSLLLRPLVTPASVADCVVTSSFTAAIWRLGEIGFQFMLCIVSGLIALFGLRYGSEPPFFWIWPAYLLAGAVLVLALTGFCIRRYT